MIYTNFKTYKTQISLDERYNKLNFTPDGRKHFVYRITHIIKKEYYYGSKTHKKLSVLGTSYFSSSTDEEFIQDQKEKPQNYKYKIVRVFDNTTDKMIFEAYLHQYFNVKEKDNNFYNLANQTPFGFDATGKKHSEETKRKMSLNSPKPNLGRKFSEKSKRKMSEAQKGQIKSDETKKKMSIAHKGLGKGKTISEETKVKISESLKNKKYAPPQTKVTCPHCNKEGQMGIMKRWHFDNCKLIKMECHLH